MWLEYVSFADLVHNSAQLCFSKLSMDKYLIQPHCFTSWMCCWCTFVMGYFAQISCWLTDKNRTKNKKSLWCTNALCRSLENKIEYAYFCLCGYDFGLCTHTHIYLLWVLCVWSWGYMHIQVSFVLLSFLFISHYTPAHKRSSAWPSTTLLTPHKPTMCFPYLYLLPAVRCCCKTGHDG